MAEGVSTFAANAVIDAICNATNFYADAVYVQLHTGAPGANGTANVAGNATRKIVPFTAALNGACESEDSVVWDAPEVDTSEDYTHFTLWDSEEGGNFLWSGTVTSNPVNAGDTWTIPAGGLTLSIPTAS